MHRYQRRYEVRACVYQGLVSSTSRLIAEHFVKKFNRKPRRFWRRRSADLYVDFCRVRQIGAGRIIDFYVRDINDDEERRGGEYSSSQDQAARDDQAEP